MAAHHVGHRNKKSGLKTINLSPSKVLASIRRARRARALALQLNQLFTTLLATGFQTTFENQFLRFVKCF